MLSTDEFNRRLANALYPRPKPIMFMRDEILGFEDMYNNSLPYILINKPELTGKAYAYDNYVSLTEKIVIIFRIVKGKISEAINARFK